MKLATALAVVAYQRNEAFSACTQLAVLNRQQADLISRLKSESPFTGALRFLHPLIRSRCQTLFEAGEYENAIFVACKVVEDEIRQRGGLDECTAGIEVVTKTMAGDQPPLRLSDHSNEHQGAHLLVRGLLLFLRNPRGHRFHDDDQADAFAVMGFTSLMLKKLDHLAPISVASPS
jgi:uncharacterized protein (TIGR02391 family)